MQNILSFVPFSEGASKGRAYRATTTYERHFANFEEALSDIPTFRGLAAMTLFNISELAKKQLPKPGEAPKEPSFNVLFAQDCKDPNSHMFTDVQTGSRIAGFGVMVPMYDGIKPVVLYEDLEDTASDASANFPV